ncbi:MAG: hypothetical protein GY835_27255 [bacterium]|nr:hypothetical protein [bacterium]
MRSSYRIIGLLPLMMLAVIAGCGGGTESTPPPPPPPAEITWILPTVSSSILVLPQSLEVQIANVTPASVEFYVDDQSIGIDTTAPFTATWAETVQNSLGSHILKTIARDGENATLVESTKLVLIADNYTYRSGRFGGPGEDIFRAIALSSTGRLFAAGDINTSSGKTGWMISINNDGTETGLNTFGPGCLTDLDITADGGCILSGYTWSAISRDGPNQWVIKVAADCTAEWSNVGGVSSAWEYPLAITTCIDGGYVLTGRREDSGGTSSTLFVRKLDTNGAHLWQYDNYSTANSIGHDIIETADGGFLITGVENDRLLLLKLDAAGGEIWSETHTDGGNFSSGHSVIEISGGYVVVGTCNNDIWLLAVDALGGHDWDTTFDFGGSVDQGRCVAATLDGGYIITGSKVSGGDRQLLLLKTDAAGSSIWSSQFGATGSDEGLAVVQTPEGGYLIAGGSDSEETSGNDAWILETTAAGALIQD